jgi:hypothetical protein
MRSLYEYLQPVDEGFFSSIKNLFQFKKAMDDAPEEYIKQTDKAATIDGYLDWLADKADGYISKVGNYDFGEAIHKYIKNLKMKLLKFGISKYEPVAKVLRQQQELFSFDQK